MLNTQPNEPTPNVNQSGDRNVTVNGDNNGIIVTGDGNSFYFKSSPTLQMRASVGDFVGRENEIAELMSALKSGQNTSICGIKGLGGIGKTELALKVAEQVKDLYPTQLRVDLMGTSERPRSPEDALGYVIRSFYPDEIKLPDSLEDLTQLYLHTLGNKPVLLLLDNAADSDQVRPFMPPSKCALLITSRDPVMLPNIHPLKLDELPPDDARELLMEIASRVTPDIADEICQLCGYLPLAIRAAGGLLKEEEDLEPEDYVKALRDKKKRLKELGRVGDKDLNVTAAFDLSYERLDPEQQRVFRALSVFESSFDATAEIYVAEDEEHRAIAALTKRSLVNYNHENKRYRLHDLVRVFADDKSNADEHRAVQMRFARYYSCVAIGAQWKFESRNIEEKQQALYRFHDERENIFAGQEWTARQTEDDAMWCCSKYALVLADFSLTGMLPSIPILDAGLKAAQQLGDRDDEARHLSNLGTAYYAFDEVHRSISFYEQALVITREIGNRRGEVADLGNLGNAYFKVGDKAKAIELTEQALRILKEIELGSLDIFKLQGQLQWTHLAEN